MRRENRLRKEADFRRVRTFRRPWTHPLLVLYAAPNGSEVTRVGVSAGRHIGKAVVRNRARRRVREAARLLLAAVEPGSDVLLVARQPAAQADWRTLQQTVRDLFVRARLLRRAPSPG